MGSINIRKTMQNNRFANQKPKIVICNEIHKSIDTPENIILAQILFAILVYCNRYLSSKSILKSGAKLDVPTLESLAFIRNFVTNLLATKSIKAILPLAIDNMNNFDSFFKLMIDRIYLGKVPKNFVGIYTIFYQWKYYVWVSSREYELVKNTLRYYFYNLKNLNLLYESWVFYKILDLFTGIFDLRLAETSHSNGVATFRSHDGSISITYQRTYESGWIDSQGPIIYDKPDIVIEFNNLITLILDAKNSIITPTNPYPYRRQMDDYIASAGLDRTSYAILIFSTGVEENWKEISRREPNNGLEHKIFWLSLVPTLHDKKGELNERAIERIVQLIKDCETKSRPNTKKMAV